MLQDEINKLKREFDVQRDEIEKFKRKQLELHRSTDSLAMITEKVDDEMKG